LENRKNNFRRLLLSLEVLAELGPAMTAERDFAETAHSILNLVMEAVAAREGALLTFTDRPAMLSSLSACGFALFPESAVIPLLPRHVHALQVARGAQALSPGNCDGFLSANGNIAPELFRCLAPLRVGGRLVGALALGRRAEDAPYEAEELEALGLVSSYVALAVYNHNLSQSLQQRIAENLRLLASLHSYYDHTLEAFAAAIDVKDYNLRGHSLRVGRYAAGIAEAMGMEEGEVQSIRAGGYLHDIGKVAVDKYIFHKPAALDEREFAEMADHTVVGHQIVSGIQFPWPRIPEVVRWHHERADGSGYPDHLRNGDVALPVKVVALADSFDAMLNERPYRPPMAVGEALSELLKLTPQKFDPNVVQALLVQVRRDSTGRNQAKFLDSHIVCNIAPTDVDQLASTLSYRINNGRVYSA
jgi:putative nucleotidyltransferase with HDIG domain